VVITFYIFVSVLGAFCQYKKKRVSDSGRMYLPDTRNIGIASGIKKKYGEAESISSLFSINRDQEA